MPRTSSRSTAQLVRLLLPVILVDCPADLRFRWEQKKLQLNLHRFYKKPKFGQVAQLVEQWTENPCVGGSIPPLTTSKNSDPSAFLR